MGRRGAGSDEAAATLKARGGRRRAMRGAIIPVFFDFVCPWSYSGRARERRLQREEGLRFVHVPWEIHPSTPPEGKRNDHPPPGERLRALAREGGIDLRIPERLSNSRRALRGVFYARARDAEEAYVDACFEAYWERQADLHDDETLRRVARESGLDEDGLLRATEDAAWDVVLAAGDEWAEALGVETTVTYVVGGKAFQGLGSYDAVRNRLAGYAPSARR